MIYLVVSLLVVGFVFDAERDTIQFRPNEAWFKSDYWIKKAKKGNSVFQQTIIAAFGDGWHLTKTLYIWCWAGAFSIVFTQLQGQSFLFGVITWLFLWFSNGVVFELTYGNRDKF